MVLHPIPGPKQTSAHRLLSCAFDPQRPFDDPPVQAKGEADLVLRINMAASAVRHFLPQPNDALISKLAMEPA